MIPENILAQRFPNQFRELAEQQQRPAPTPESQDAPQASSTMPKLTGRQSRLAQIQEALRFTPEGVPREVHYKKNPLWALQGQLPYFLNGKM